MTPVRATHMYLPLRRPVHLLLVLVMASNCTTSSGGGARRECEESGGKWVGPVGLGEYACARPARDSGARCTDSTQCEGDCVTDSETGTGRKAAGECSELTSNLGQCINLVAGGKAQGVMCLD